MHHNPYKIILLILAGLIVLIVVNTVMSDVSETRRQRLIDECIGNVRGGKDSSMSKIVVNEGEQKEIDNCLRRYGR